MKINAIYVKSTREILYSRANHDCRYSSDGKGFIDGGFGEIISCGKYLDDIIALQLDGDILLKQILYYDWNLGNRDILPEHIDGYHGRYKLTRYSDTDFFSRLVINWDDIKALYKLK